MNCIDFRPRSSASARGELWRSEEYQRLQAEARTRAGDLPDFSASGLNRASPIAHDFSTKQSATVLRKRICHTCGTQNSRRWSTRSTLLECGRCAEYRYRKGKPWVPLEQRLIERTCSNCAGTWRTQVRGTADNGHNECNRCRNYRWRVGRAWKAPSDDREAPPTWWNFCVGCQEEKRPRSMMSGTTRETRLCAKCNAKAREAAQSSGGGDTSERIRQSLTY